MKDITLDHGSRQIVEIPDLSLSRLFNDYGRGFYCAEHSALAESGQSRKGPTDISMRMN